MHSFLRLLQKCESYGFFQRCYTCKGRQITALFIDKDNGRVARGVPSGKKGD
jgi:hypothetical protein